MSERRVDLDSPLPIICSVSDWLHLVMVASSGRQTLAECEDVLLDRNHVQGQLAAVDRALGAISRGLADARTAGQDRA